MQINTNKIDQLNHTNRLPRASGGGVSVPADGGGLHSPPPPLSAAITRDLLDPTVSALDLCDYHNLTLNDLLAIINSDDFKYLKSAIEQVNTARQALIESEARTAALATLTQLTRRPIESQKHAETARKAATKLEHITRPNIQQKTNHPKRPPNCSNPMKNPPPTCTQPPPQIPSPIAVCQRTQKREHTMSRTRIISSVLATAAAAASAQTTELYSQDFSTQGLGYTTSVAEFSDGWYDFFSQSDANTWNASINYNNTQGAYFAAMDLDGEGATLPLTLTTDTFDITNATNIQFAIDLAEDNASDGNNDWDSTDFVHFEYQIDGGAWTNIFSAINDGSTYNSAAFINGTQITDTFSTFTADLADATGSTMAIRLVWNLNAGDEDLAIDNILITAETIAVVPLPPAAFAALGLLGIMAAKRRFRNRTHR